MKAIISHDIDHITVLEHLFKDTIVPKFMMRMHIELLKGKITSREYLLRWGDFFKNKWQNIDELITFNNVNHIPSSFFIAVKSGIGLNYSNTTALLWIEQMKHRHCEIGAHGIEFEGIEKINDEFQLFQSLQTLNGLVLECIILEKIKTRLVYSKIQDIHMTVLNMPSKIPIKLARCGNFRFK
jgi:hypothetical protein